MPQGNHQWLPSGIWYQKPASSSYPKLVLATCRQVGLVVSFLVLYNGYRSMAWNWTYTEYIGKTMTQGKYSIATHEPASVEYIDQLKREMEEKRQKKYDALQN